jgi:hypothetical protein
LAYFAVKATAKRREVICGASLRQTTRGLTKPETSLRARKLRGGKEIFLLLLRLLLSLGLLL